MVTDLQVLHGVREACGPTGMERSASRLRIWREVLAIQVILVIEKPVY